MEKQKILLVDDNDQHLKIAEHELKKAGHDPKKALSGRDALKLLQKEMPKGHFHVAFVDFMMPEMNGIELCGHIHKAYPDIELVLLSGVMDLVSKEQLDRFHANGGREVLQKNPGNLQLADTVTRLSEAKQERERKLQEKLARQQAQEAEQAKNKAA